MFATPRTASAATDVKSGRPAERTAGAGGGRFRGNGRRRRRRRGLRTGEAAVRDREAARDDDAGDEAGQDEHERDDDALTVLHDFMGIWGARRLVGSAATAWWPRAGQRS